ncbi:MAG: hypothetical protein K6F86_05755 [Lachnospiraceae bacterium]|nr:hypothetical protein [Lachnospiraceae bacterium]
MKGSYLSKRIRACLLAAAVLASAVPFKADVRVYADEVADEGESPVDEEIPADGEVPADGELTDDLFADGEMSDAGTGTGVTQGTILANNGLYIANTFPDSMMPSGFHRQTVAYQGQNIDLAYMDNSDAVVLAYLTDVTGTVGDFYLCDTATATMSDYVKLDGGNGAFLIILDPGDNINPPAGFNKAVLNIDNKSVTAWTLPDGSSTDEEDKDKKDKKKKEGFFRVTETVYAGDLGLGIGAGSSDAGTGEVPANTTVDTTNATVVDNSYVDGTTVDDAANYEDAAAAEVAAANVQVDAAGFVKAQPSEFFLIYGIDYNGAQGFFLYDTLGHTYQRYLEMDTGESESTEKYRKSAQIRLFIIAGLILFSVVLIFIIVNMSLNGRRGGGRNLDDDDDVEEMKRRVRKKEVSAIRRNGGRRYAQDDGAYDEDDDYEGQGGYGQQGGYGYNNVSMQGDYPSQEEDIRYYDRGDSRTGRGVQRNDEGRAPERMNQSRPGVRTEMRSNVRTEARPQQQIGTEVRNESRPGVRTERRPYPPEADGQGYMDQGMQQGGMQGGYGGPGMGNDPGMNGGYMSGGRQDIDLDDDFNFDFIKPGK